MCTINQIYAQNYYHKEISQLLYSNNDLWALDPIYDTAAH